MWDLDEMKRVSKKQKMEFAVAYMYIIRFTYIIFNYVYNITQVPVLQLYSAFIVNPTIPKEREGATYKF